MGAKKIDPLGWRQRLDFENLAKTFSRQNHLENYSRSVLVKTHVQVYRTSSSSDDEDEDIPKSCGKYAISWIEGILKSALKCLGGRGSFKMNNIFEIVTRASCLLKCTLQEEGTIGDDGILDDVAAALYFEDSFDEPVKDISVPLLQSCFSLADDFNPKDYWCKSYLPFIECCLGSILKGFIPYVGDCIANPIIGILFSSIKYLTPDSPKLAESMEEVRSAMRRKTRIKCLNTNCTRMYEYKKVNGTNAVVLYNENMEVLLVESKKSFLHQATSEYDNDLDDPEFAPKSCDTYAFLWVKGIVKSLLKLVTSKCMWFIFTFDYLIS
ncbi:unnamed protein product [Orchesella dallaii]|uniref:Uncharacterized protein n=1 Tax=Orchesella dallaii TaxID=48710 RepID=A0ABP1Q0I7_9HEXA